ncbi:fatty acyl-AMP ligase [Rhizobium sp. SL86]|uniref:fatty acyl-AMP ligase n=1 Tax=Rhizobium sp. SL86 TaxID=2995148 RepID=UPI002273555B|nr:fatty acyl-AMP ligase [Rhizobium sp. SL86]MCY1669381.1 fatty acyl-AMP ligase [Rhizobium sp. SL86]
MFLIKRVLVAAKSELIRYMQSYSSLLDMLIVKATVRRDHKAVVFVPEANRPEVALSFLELWQQAQTLAADLSAKASPGDRAILLFPTGLEFVVSYFACLMAGIIAVPLMPPRKTAGRDASIAIIEDCRPRIFLTSGEEGQALQTASLARFHEAGVDHVPVTLTSRLLAFTPVSLSPESIAFLQYTSGSTSVPKGVMVSHGNLLANLEMMRSRLGNHECSTHVSWIPLYHDLGLIMNLLQPLYVGATSVLMTPSTFMHRPLHWLQAIHKHKAEVAAAPNFAYDLCVDRYRADAMDGIDLSGWKLAVNGAEPVRQDTLARFAECFQRHGFNASAMHPTYGLAEATLVATSAVRGRGPYTAQVSAHGLHARRIVSPRDIQDRRQIVSCGSAVSGVEVAIVDPQECIRQPKGLIGEIWLRGASIAGGYWNNVKASRETFDARLADPDDAGGWLRTGDLGHVDDAGELFVAGRIKDVIIIRGVNYYPQDIEGTAATAHTALRRDHCAVFTVLDEKGLEQVILVQEVERTQRHNLDERAICAAIRKAVAENHDISLTKIALIRPGNIPKTTSGKIQRHRARDLWLAGAFEHARLVTAPLPFIGPADTQTITSEIEHG